MSKTFIPSKCTNFSMIFHPHNLLVVAITLLIMSSFIKSFVVILN